MSRCGAEMCIHWTGQGCICEVLGEEPEMECQVCGHFVERLSPAGWCDNCEEAVADELLLAAQGDGQ